MNDPFDMDDAYDAHSGEREAMMNRIGALESAMRKVSELLDGQLAAQAYSFDPLGERVPLSYGIWPRK